MWNEVVMYAVVKVSCRGESLRMQWSNEAGANVRRVGRIDD